MRRRTGSSAWPLQRHHQQLPTIDADRISHRQLPAAAGLDQAVHAHIAALDAPLGLTTGGHQTLKFEVLIQLAGHGGGGGREP